MERLTPFKIARNKFLNLSLRTFFSYFYYKLRSYQERKFYYKDELDFDWKKINFNRTALLNFLINNHPLGTNLSYLEIGCASDINFNSIIAHSKTGVDPDRGGNIRLTSDDFFKNQNKKYDLIFIDGLHTYEQVKKDFINSTKVLNPNGIIVLDDMIPRNWKEHQTPRIQSLWTGDVWKLLFDLNKIKSLNYKVLLIDSGQCVVFPENLILTDEFFSNKMANKEFDYFYNHFEDIPTIELKDGLDWIKNSLS